MDAKTRTKNGIFCIAFGGNVETRFGDPLKTMMAAIRHIGKLNIRITQVSRFYDTPAFPEGSGPNFVNGALKCSTSLDPSDLLKELHVIEEEFGRQRTARWGARTLDLDILLNGENVLPDHDIWQYWHDLPAEKQVNVAPDQLLLPHPRLQDRAFVLVPLADVAPDWKHPVLNKTVKEMLADLPENLKNEVKPL